MPLSDAEQEELKTLTKTGLSPAEQAELDQLQGKPSMAQAALETGLKGMDYQRGMTTAPGIARLLGVYDPAQQERIAKFQEQAPSVIQMAEKKFGTFPTGPKVSDVFPEAKNKWYDLTTKGAADAALTALSDPTTWESAGLNQVAKGGTGILARLARAAGLANKTGLTKAGTVARAVISPVESLLSNRAGAQYRKAFEPVDRFAEQEGKVAVPSELLRKEGFVGTMDAATQTMKDINARQGTKIGSIINEAERQGATVPILEEFKPAMEEAKRLRSLGDADAEALATKIDDKILKLWETHGEHMPIAKAQEVKTFIDRLIGDSGFAQDAEAAIGTKARKAITQGGLREGVETALPKELQAPFQEAKSIYGATAPAVTDKITKMSNQAKELRGPFGLTDVDMMLLGSGLTGLAAGSHVVGNSGLGAFALKKLVNAARSTEGRTIRGRAYDILGPGTKGVLDPTLRRSAWSLLNQENKK